mmetsp:Transcript_17643/g.45599  ORF Transcript_17643/g.45599 Transcript_17643/m.45599 type:complete len:93 (-) Transcript_17643:482-760(-)
MANVLVTCACYESAMRSRCFVRGLRYGSGAASVKPPSEAKALESAAEQHPLFGVPIGERGGKELAVFISAWRVEPSLRGPEIRECFESEAEA